VQELSEKIASTLSVVTVPADINHDEDATVRIKMSRYNATWADDSNSKEREYYFPNIVVEGTQNSDTG
jgi:hypothetical protein